MTQLGRYQLKNVLGRGAMGMVYEALDPRLERRVAIKTILKSHLLDDAVAEDYSRRFVREAQAAARLNHPHIVTVFDFGEEDEIAYIVMEFIEGGELTQMFDAQHPFTLHEAVRILCELLDALAYAHERGIVHRDVKPANVMIDRAGHVKLTDFGVARLAETNADRTLPGTMVGTPSYMSPEQIQGQAVGSRTDLFAVGVILYQFLTQQRPFAGGGQWVVQRKILHEDPAPPSQLEPSVPKLFDTIALRALAKDPDHRYQNARAFADELQLALSTLPPVVRPRNMPDPDVTVFVKSGTATGGGRSTATAPMSLTKPAPAPTPPSKPTATPPSSMATGSTVPAAATAPSTIRRPQPQPPPPPLAPGSTMPASAAAGPPPLGATPLDWARAPAATWLPPRPATTARTATPPVAAPAPAVRRDPVADSPYARRRPSWRWLAGLAAVAGLPLTLLLWRPAPAPAPAVEPRVIPTKPTVTPPKVVIEPPAVTRPAPGPVSDMTSGAPPPASTVNPPAAPPKAPSAPAPSPASRTTGPANPDPGSTVKPDRRPAVGAPAAQQRPPNARCAELLERLQLGEALSPELLEIFQKECKR
ncbi:protein kinase [Aquincola sp. S2]|uniref:Protein kinase n=1 Tax=Pseudaquabacterium terrae TaxID=2732868 RepID=A0ABX2EDY1_9BURK|nr:serine/threonine-protein kinase [Aquabacterium terrae]NRF66823.1 protein kinase [Aquabacterium terrae]